jgi:hypothetical protein
MKIGDLVRVEKCSSIVHCSCFFCSGKSNCVGIVLAPAELDMWHVMFDVGEWEVYEHEVKIISESDYLAEPTETTELTDEQLECVIGGLTTKKFEEWKINMINEHGYLFNSKKNM